MITDCNQAKVFFLSEKMPHLQHFWWNNRLSNLAFNVPAGGKWVSKLGWQFHQHDHPLWKCGHPWCRQPVALPLTRSVCGLDKIGWLSKGALFDDSSTTKWVRLKITPLTTSFIITQPSLSHLSHIPWGSAVMRKEPSHPRYSSLSELCFLMHACVRGCVHLKLAGVQFCAEWASVHHWAQLSGLCRKHRSSQRTLIGSAGNDELEVDEVEMN